MRNLRYATFAAIIAIAMCGTAQAQDAATDDNGDIVVTAQRTDQKLQDVPVSVSAVGAVEIQRKQINGALDINRVAPNVQFDGVVGGTSGLKPFIRGGGVTDGGFVLSESEVAIYIDDVYQARLSGASIEQAVLERIEVLRGPQGVLFGRNSSAGAVNFISKGPAENFEGFIEGGYGTWNERRFKGYISTPLSSDGAWRASASGLIRARDGGQQYNATLKKEVGATRSEGGQVVIAYKGDSFEGKITGFYNNNSGDGQYSAATAVNASGVLVPVSGSYRIALSPVDSYSRNEQYGVRAHLSLDYSGGTLKSITGYSELREGWKTDFGGGGANPLAPVSLFVRETVASQKQFSQELQASGKIGRLDYVAGIYFFNETATQDSETTIFGNLSRLHFEPKTSSFAAYAQFAYHLTDTFSVTAAGRYTIDNKDLYGGFNGANQNFSNKYEKFTPKFGFDWKITPDVMLYGSVGQGFKSGGYNGLAANLSQLEKAFKPQITTAYELGLKTSLFDRHLRFNIAAFWNDIKDRQQTAGAGNGFIIENYNVRIRGIEAEFSLKVAEGLTIYGNGAINDGKYTSASVAIPTVFNNKPPSLPDSQFTLGTDYSVDIGPGKLGFGADVRYTALYFSTPDNSQVGKVEPRTIVNGYVSYDVGPFSFQLTGKNLTDVNTYQTGFTIGTVSPRFIIEPRTFLGTVRYKF